MYSCAGLHVQCISDQLMCVVVFSVEIEVLIRLKELALYLLQSSMFYYIERRHLKMFVNIFSRSCHHERCRLVNMQGDLQALAVHMGAVLCGVCCSLCKSLTDSRLFDSCISVHDV